MFHYPAIDFFAATAAQRFATCDDVFDDLRFTCAGVIKVHLKCPSIFVRKQGEDGQIGMPAKVVVLERVVEVFDNSRFCGLVNLLFKSDPPGNEIKFRREPISPPPDLISLPPDLMPE